MPSYLWRVGLVYCSNPTSPGGSYRSAIGRLFFQTKEMIQALEAPDVVRNKVSFWLLGFLDGQVSLKDNICKGDGGYLYDIHFWIGKGTSQDEAGTTAIKTVELDA